MKNLFPLFVLAFVLISLNAKASSLDDDFSSLGTNAKILERAKELDPHNRIRIVQKRLVDRHWRLEVDANYGLTTGTDTYLNSTQAGATLELHINPKWSVGFRYSHFFNELTAEGKTLYQQALQNKEATGNSGSFPDISYPLNTYLGTISWYPLYGKISWFNEGVSQFDVYTLLGYGTTVTDSMISSTYAAGGGIAFWWSEHVSSRFELRYQHYEDALYDSPVSRNVTLFTFAMGWLL